MYYGDHKSGLDDPRTLEILTTEPWSLLTSRTLGYQDISVEPRSFVAILSAAIVALALAHPTQLRPVSLLPAALLMTVNLCVGLMAFARGVAINYKDGRWVAGMNLLRHAYRKIVPELEALFVTAHQPRADQKSLAHGAPQHPANRAKSLATTSSVFAALNSVLTGALASDLTALFGGGRAFGLAIGTAIPIVSAVLHVLYAGRYGKRHTPLQ
ncbi:MAG: hypothetical protein M3041_16235 [Acidobacteriota bacterium]|nr:hypothetical protein [Acidobacteriota bacterium]